MANKPEADNPLDAAKFGQLSAIFQSVDMPTLAGAYPVLKAQSSRQVQDEFQGTYFTGLGTQSAAHQAIEPVYNPAMLNRYAMASGILRTCIDAMVTNIDGFGFTLEYIGPEGQQDGEEAQAEHARVMGVLDHPNGEYSLVDLRRRWRADKESTGYATMEIIRNQDDGFPDVLYHVPSHTIRMTTQDGAATETSRYMPRPGAGPGNMMKVKTRFRRYVQMNNGKTTFFKECGDTRTIDAATGAEVREATNEATEILLDAHYTPGSKYGAPRWIGDLRSVLGIQESENTNLSYFKDNGIPAMMLLVMGGALTAKAQEDFERLVRQSRGSNMQQKIVLVEVRGDEMAASDKGTVQRPEVRLEPLLQVRQQDAFFQNYEENSAKKIRSSFRLPALFTGLSEEVRYAVAQASLTMAESQVFGPERVQTDDLFNYHVLTYNGKPMTHWRFKSNPPRIQDSVEIMNALAVLENVGAMTPNIAIALANGLFDMDTPLIDEPWGDMPFTLTVGKSIDPNTGKFEEDEEPPESPDLPPPADPTVGTGAFPPPPTASEAPVSAARAAAKVQAAKTAGARQEARKTAKAAKGRHRDAMRVEKLTTTKRAAPAPATKKRRILSSGQGDAMTTPGLHEDNDVHRDDKG